MPINYQERTEEEYRRRASVMIQNFEGYRAGPYDAGDNMATIGFGYTFNRSNNLELWDRAGVQLSQAERQQLRAIDAAPAGQKTAMGLAFGVQITQEEARSLLENASLSRYEGHATNLNMPFSDERAAVVSITYNRGTGRMATHMQGFNDAISDGDRAEAWYQVRYNSFGTAAIGTNNEFGIRARRNMESQIFGLYDDPLNVTPEEARNVYRMFQLHRDDILENERNWGVDLDGNQARRSAIAQADANYPDLIQEYGHVQTLASALEPARNKLLEELRTENPELADRLRNEDFATTAIYLDPGRELRTGNLRPDQRNNTSQAVDENHATTIDSKRMRGNTEVESNDLLIGGGGDDTLRSHRGNDILIGGQGRDRMEGGEGHDTYVIGAGDTVKDSDGLGEVRWGGQELTGGRRSESDPANTYRSEDGRFIYTLEHDNLSITDTQASDQAPRERAVIENFQSGQLGITLSGPGGGDARPQAAPQKHSGGPDPSGPRPEDAAMVEQLRSSVAGLDEKANKPWNELSDRMVASAYKMAVEAGFKPDDKVAVALNLPTATQSAGETMFVMRSGPGASPDPYANRAQMPTSEALAASAQQQYLAANQTRDMQEQSRLQELAQAHDRGPDDPSKSGPKMA
ncbi:XVIPCD domain-containing protein [Xanthomonas sp. SI]|uniref:XVIPCD domain-containing protein n=1 Tax=Xanthomonas sp. SI TaxID=2724123 RepID=UPI00163A3E0A|nr:XVIPCD domain-containing protein [Xanthomonas sp. SI]QNH13517.1 hypothetical protein HEP75_02968 [Xanthomonas sp. SI]